MSWKRDFPNLRRNKMAKGFSNVTIMEPTRKKTNQSGNHSMVKTSTMNKSARKSYKKYRGQGR